MSARAERRAPSNGAGPTRDVFGVLAIEVELTVPASPAPSP